MRRSLMTILAVLALGALLITGCGDDDEQVDSRPKGDEPAGGQADQAQLPADPATIIGPIASIPAAEPVGPTCEPDGVSDPDEPSSDDTDTDPESPVDDTAACTPSGDDILGTFLFAAGTGRGEVDAASVTVTKDTTILKADGDGGWTAGRFDDLRSGTEVQVWALDGMMAESYPVQFEASTVAYGGPPDPNAPDVTIEPPESGPSGSGPATPPSDVPSTDRPNAVPAEAPTSSGTVASVAGPTCPGISPSTPGTCADQVVGTVSVDTSSGQGPELSARIIADTVILVHDGTGWTNGSVNDVQAGATVRVWVKGGVLTKSIPAQGDAATIAVGPLDG